MTATHARPGKAPRRYKFSIIRILICGILLSALVTAAMYLKFSAVDFFHARLLEQESKTSAWILKQVSFALPWIFICMFHSFVYNKHDRRDSIVQREMFWEVFLVTVFTYCILLPRLMDYSDAMYAAALEAGAKIPQTDGKVDQTFIMLFHEWFIRMTVPLGALMLFHSARARRERLFPITEADADEPLMTRAEYDAMKAAEAAASEETAEGVETASPSEADDSEAQAPAEDLSAVPVEAQREDARHA